MVSWKGEDKFSSILLLSNVIIVMAMLDIDCMMLLPCQCVVIEWLDAMLFFFMYCRVNDVFLC